MKKKYLVIPGWIHSINDGQRHHITAGDLIKLYGVNPQECLVLAESIARDEHSPPPPGYTWSYLNSLTRLEPRHDGNYKL